MINKKKLIYLGVGLVSAYFLFPYAQQSFEYIKNKIKKPATPNEPTKPIESVKPKVDCQCVKAPCDCGK
jgi:hypothetical protein